MSWGIGKFVVYGAFTRSQSPHFFWLAWRYVGGGVRKTREGRLIGDQIFRSGTSVAANCRAACRAARSRSEFISKLTIVEEEADKTLFWLEMLSEMEVVKKDRLTPLIKENDEIVAIVVSSIKTAKSNKQSKITNSKFHIPQ